MSIKRALHIGRVRVGFAAGVIAILLGKFLEGVFTPSGQNRVGHDDQVVADLDAALFDDFANRARQVLVGSHTAGNAVHDNADSLDFHGPASFQGSGF